MIEFSLHADCQDRGKGQWRQTFSHPNLCLAGITEVSQSPVSSVVVEAHTRALYIGGSDKAEMNPGNCNTSLCLMLGQSWRFYVEALLGITDLEIFLLVWLVVAWPNTLFQDIVLVACSAVATVILHFVLEAQGSILNRIPRSRGCEIWKQS